MVTILDYYQPNIDKRPLKHQMKKRFLILDMYFLDNNRNEIIFITNSLFALKIPGLLKRSLIYIDYYA